MPIRIATAPVSWGIMEVEGWARRQTYAEVLDEMVQAGYTGTELGPYGFLPTDSQELKRELEKRNLTLLGAFVPLPLGHPERHQEGMRSALEIARLLAANGAPFIVLADEMSEKRMAIAGRAGRDHGFTEAQWEDAAKLLSCIARNAQEIGVRSVFHHHAGTYIETPDEVARLLDVTDPLRLGICLDTGHYFYGGGDPVEFARAHAHRIWHLHLKDIRANVLEKVRREKIAYLEAIRSGVFSELGQGDVDLAGVIHELDKAGFDGWAVFEQDIDPTVPGTNPLASATRSRDYLRRAAGV
ncbi:MAG: TIM barrel protein [Bryobacteraceae bacterium]